MSVSRLPSGKWRAQIYRDGKNVSVSQILGPDYKSFETKKEAKAARAKAQEVLGSRPTGMTVATFAELWLSDPMFQRPKESTNIHNAERVKRFVAKYGTLAMANVGDDQVTEWLRGGKNKSTVPALRAMFNDAASKEGGRIVQTNPFAGLRLKRSTGNRDIDPPSEELVWSLIAAARKQAGPHYAAWLQVAAFTGMRPGEVDALRWDAVDFDEGRIFVREQFNAKSKTFTLPKNGRKREAILTPPAREALTGLAKTSPFCFVNLRGEHWAATSRAYHWKATRAQAGWDKSLYLATRHFAGWYMRNVLRLDAEDVAIALGHEDGGELVRRLYGHLDRNEALNRVAKAYASVGQVTPLRVVREEQ